MNPESSPPAGSPVLRRVHPGEWLTGLAGLAVLAGLFLPWAGEASSFESFSVLKLIVLLFGLAAAAVPVVVASSSRTDVPIVWETFLSTAALLVAFLLFIRLAWSPEQGLGSGFYLILGGSLLATVAGWRSVSREN